jgi:pimeloyl-ACP methyl ester carboxylesterase
MTWNQHPAEIDGISFAHKTQGEGPPLLLIHGVGPGTMGLANFGPIVDRLAAHFTLHMIDLIGFGASGRKPVGPYFDVALWLRQIGVVLNAIGQPAFVLGNSIGAALALKAASGNPRVRAVVAVGGPIAPFEMPAALRAFWSVPQDEAGLAAAMRPMTAAQKEPDPALVAQRFALFADAAFSAHFGALVAEGRAGLGHAVLTEAEAAAITCPVTLVYGRDDRACPPDLILPQVAPLLPGADAVLLGSCGHNVAFERGDALITLVNLRFGAKP